MSTSNYVDPSISVNTTSNNNNNNNDQKSMEHHMKSPTPNNNREEDNKTDLNLATDKVKLAAKHAEQKQSNPTSSETVNTGESIKQKLSDVASVASTAVKDTVANIEEKVAPHLESMVNAVKEVLHTGDKKSDESKPVTIDSEKDSNSNPVSTASTPRGDAKMDSDMKKMNVTDMNNMNNNNNNNMDNKDSDNMDTSSDAKSAKRKLDDRGEKLEEVQNKSSKLEEKAEDFANGAKKLKEKMKNKAGL